jgi:hypothetical protein
MFGGIDLQEILFVVVPLVLLLCWLLSRYLGKYRTNLIVSMLLVLFDLPYTLGVLAVMSGRCDLQGLMRPGSRTIKHLQGFFTNNNATGNILWCDWDGFHTD